MEITEIKDTIAERAGSYSDAIVGSLRSLADAVTGTAHDYADEAQDAAADLPGLNRGANYTRMGLWFGLGVALAGGAIYAWQLYRRQNQAPKAPRALLPPARRDRKSAPAPGAKARANASSGQGTGKRAHATAASGKSTSKHKPNASK